MNLSGCIDYMREKHKGQLRKQKTPYYMHPLEVSNILKKKGFSEEYQIVGLFHDLLEDTNSTYEEIKEMTSEKIADAVKLLTKEDGYIMEEYIYNIKENEISRNVKLADRLHNLSELQYTSKEFRDKYIAETKKYFIDLAENTVFKKDLEDMLLKLEKEEL